MTAARFAARFGLAADDAPPICTIWYIQMRLGRQDYSIPRMLSYVDKLIDAWHFPKPFPRLKKGDLICDSSDKSRWPRDAVDQWLSDYLPPESAAALDAAAHKAAAATMDNRAGFLQLVKAHRPKEHRYE